MYQFSSRIRFSECGEHRLLRCGALLDYFQDCVTFHCEDIGLPHGKLLREGRFWVLSAWNVTIHRLPELGERVNIITNPYDFKGCFGRRNFRMDSAGGGELAVADSLWTLLSVESGAPIACPAEEIALYGPEEPFPMDYTGRKIRLPAAPAETFPPVPVSREMLDDNGHVNNCQYIHLALRYLPDVMCPCRLRVEYKKAALPGDSIHPALYREEGRQILAMCDGEGKLFAAVELSKKTV